MRSCLAAAGWISLIGASLFSIPPLASAQDLAIESTHTGTFLLGQTNAYYLLRVRNVGAVATSGYVSVAENAPAGLTITSMYGQGWECTVNSCGTSEPLPAGDSYSAIMVQATVAVNAPASLTNQATVTGGGDINAANNTANDVTSVAAHGQPVGWGQDDCEKTQVPQSYTDIVALSTGRYHSLALRSNGTVLAWGQDPMFNYATAVPAGLSGVVAIAAGDAFSLALKGDGTVVFWGYGTYGPPVSLYNIVAIAANMGGGSMALQSNGTVLVWGTAGTGLTTVPLALSGVVGIAMGTYNCLALKSDGTVVAWGASGYGQEAVPAGLSNVTAIAAGHHHNLALRRDGTVVAWGTNVQGETTVPAGLSNVAAIAAGDTHSLALKSDGTVVAWGYDGLGQTAIPAGLSNVFSVAAKWGNSLALTDAVPVTTPVSLHLLGPGGMMVESKGPLWVPNGPVTVDSTTYDGPALVLNWLPRSSHTIGTESTVARDIVSRFAFSNWSDQGAITHTVAATAATTFTANFNTQYKITTVANPPEGGTITPATGFFDELSSVQFTATPNTGYPFVGFTGGLTGATNPQTLTVSQATTITANFTAITSPAAPALSYPANGATQTFLSLTLQWAASAGADSYDVYFGASNPPAFYGNTVDTNYPASVVNDGSTYFWRVVAKNSGGSASSPVWSFTTVNPTPPPDTPPPATSPNCVSAVTPPTSLLPGAGGVVKLSVATNSSCTWSLPLLPAWITAPGGLAYTGSQTIDLVVAQDSGAARSASLTIGAITATIDQGASCAFTLNAGGAGFPAAGGTGSIHVAAASDCVWALSELPSWVTYTDTPIGTGITNLGYRVAANTGTRRGTTVAAGGSVFAIDQNGAVAISGGTLAHFAAGGGWQTQFTLLNTGYGTAHARLNFFDDSGKAITPSAYERPHASSKGALSAASGTDLGSALNSGAVSHIDPPGTTGGGSEESTGWAQLLTDGTVDGYGVFQLKTEAGSQEAAVLPETRSANAYYLPFDNTGGYFYGVALSNGMATAANINVIIRDADTGKVTGTDVINLASMGHTAFVMTTQYPETAAMRGTLEFTTALPGQVAVLGLRFNADHAFTSVPALVASAVPAGQTLVEVGSMAHIAAGGGWKTLFTLANPGTIAAKARLNFFGNDGKPLKVTLSVPQRPSFATAQASAFEDTLAPGTMLEVEAVGGVDIPDGTSAQGWAQLQSDGGVTGFAAFQYQPLTGGQQEAVVPLETRGAASYILPFDNTNGYINGVAVTNTSNQNAAVAVAIRNAGTGAVLKTDTISLSAMGHTSFLLDDLYESSTADAAVTVEFTAAAPGQISVLGLRFNSNNAFTSVPAMVRR